MRFSSSDHGGMSAVPDTRATTAPGTPPMPDRRSRSLWFGGHRFAAALAAALLAAWAGAGCGPGLGGTGTGADTDALAAYGAREVSVCEGDFADLLGCAAPSTGAAPAPASGARFFAEASPASRALLEVDGQEAQLRLRCADLVFIGVFGQVGAAPPRFYGQAIEGGSRAQLASLRVERIGGGLAVTLVDAAGFRLAGPQTLLPVAGTTSAATCP